MTVGQLRERKRFVFVDREGARQEFEDLLGVEDASRLLVIQEDGGLGKSHLLRHFDRRCRTVHPRTPVCLVPVDELQPKEPLTLLEAVALDLTNEFGFDFEEFWYYHDALSRADWEPFAEAPAPPVNVNITIQDTQFTNVGQVNVAGTVTDRAAGPVPSWRTTRTESGAPPAGPVGDGGRARWTNPQQEQQAIAVCIQRFFDRLLAQCAEQKVVLLLDGMEACGETLRDWLARAVLPACFMQPDDPPHLYLVLAGREIPVLEELHERWPPERIERRVRTAPRFERFDEQAIRAFLEAHEVPYQEDEIPRYLWFMEAGMTPATLAKLILDLRSRRAG